MQPMMCFSWSGDSMHILYQGFHISMVDLLIHVHEYFMYVSALSMALKYKARALLATASWRDHESTAEKGEALN